MVKQCLICGKELGMMTDKASKLSIPMKLAFNVSKMTSEEVIDRLNGNTALNNNSKMLVLMTYLEQKKKQLGL